MKSLSESKLGKVRNRNHLQLNSQQKEKIRRVEVQKQEQIRKQKVIADKHSIVAKLKRLRDEDELSNTREADASQADFQDYNN